jgi:hypothetical protein
LGWLAGKVRGLAETGRGGCEGEGTMCGWIAERTRGGAPECTPTSTRRHTSENGELRTGDGDGLRLLGKAGRCGDGSVYCNQPYHSRHAKRPFDSRKNAAPYLAENCGEPGHAPPRNAILRVLQSLSRARFIRCRSGSGRTCLRTVHGTTAANSTTRNALGL